MDAAILMHPQVWVASGHVATFADPMVDCRNCQARFRADEIEEDRCPNCGAVGQFTEARMFNLLFKTFAGPVEDEASVVYLRPETAQGMFVNFENVLTSTRKKLPFGMAQIGKSFRNEVNPRHFIFRTREFEQMEIEFFVRPEEAPRWHEYWMQERLRWYVGPGRPAGEPAADGARPGGPGALRGGVLGRGVPVPDGLAGAGGHREPARLRPAAALEGERRDAELLRRGEGRARGALHHRAVGGGGPAAAGVHRRRLPARRRCAARSGCC